MSEQRLYLMGNEFQLNKIGISVNPERRRRQIETMTGTKIKLIQCWNTLDTPAKTVEQYLHAVYSRRRTQGEWFSHISVRDIELAGYDLLPCNNDGTERRRYEQD